MPNLPPATLVGAFSPVARLLPVATLGLENDLWDPPKNNFGIRSGLMGFADQVL
jgi:hypothetical protein